MTTGPAVSAITSSALANRFKRALEAAEMHEGETVHGTRRGAMQEAERGGMARADVWSRAGIKTPNVGAMYLDQGRPPRGAQAGVVKWHTGVRVWH